MNDNESVNNNSSLDNNANDVDEIKKRNKRLAKISIIPGLIVYSMTFVPFYYMVEHGKMEENGNFLRVFYLFILCFVQMMVIGRVTTIIDDINHKGRKNGLPIVIICAIVEGIALLFYINIIKEIFKL